MSVISIFKKLLDVEQASIKSMDIEIENGETIVVTTVKLHKRHRWKCPYCKRRSPYYDQPYPSRRWRTLDFSGAKSFIQTSLPRVKCIRHGVVTAWVPWATHGARMTHAFDKLIAWTSRHMSRSAIEQLMRVNWKSVGDIVKRVVDKLGGERGSHKFDGLTAIAIDETSYRKGYKYMTVVVNHANGEVVWAGKGMGKDVLESFFALLSETQRQQISLVSADGAKWVASVVEEKCPNAIRVMDPFHVVSWATDALDIVRKRVYREAKITQGIRLKRKVGRPRKGSEAKPCKADGIKGARFALWKNPENLLSSQNAKLQMIAVSNPVLYRAYKLKEHLRLIFQMDFTEAVESLKQWLSWAQRCRIPEFVKLRAKIKRQRDAILSSIQHGLSNARIEAVNNKIKLTVRTGYGFRNIDNLIALVMLKCTSLPVSLPWKASA